MIYQETYFSDCHGVIPQIVLSSMLIQAGNIRASAYKNALTVDLSTANTFNFNGYFLELQGVLPFTESRYLLTVPSIINRVGAMNNENVSMLNDLVGLPVAGFARTTDREVELPPNIDNLSQGVLVLEKRLAYLLLLQAKRNNLNTLYNYLYYTRLAGELSRNVNQKFPVITQNSTGSYISGWIYSYSEQHAFGRSAVITNACIANLFTTYPSLKRPLPQTFEDICDWLALEMDKSDPITLPDLDFDLLVNNIAETVERLRYQEPPHDPLGLVSIDNQGDVSSEITSTGDNASQPVPLPDNPYSQGSNDSPLIDRPSADYSSLTNSEPTTDPLPSC
jgi:hypothetical protein